MEHWLDRLARGVAGEPSRRGALRRLGGLAGVVVAVARPGQAYAQTCGDCPPGATCTCTCTCPSGTDLCPSGCVNLQTDPNNCGSCGNVCPAGTTCCGGTCVNLQTDPNNCGACGNVCPAGTACQAGSCKGTVTCSQPATCTAQGGQCGVCSTGLPLQCFSTAEGGAACLQFSGASCDQSLVCTSTDQCQTQFGAGYYCAVNVNCGVFGGCISQCLPVCP